MAYASNNANPYDDTKRGSMNLNETMAIENGYKFVWDFSTSQGYNGSGSATVYWIKISKADYSFTEGKWTLASTYLEEAGIQDLTYGSRTSRGCIRNGYLYILAYNRKGFYKINVNDPADITLIPLGITTNDYGVGEGTSPNCVLIQIEDILIGKEFMILSDDTVVLTKGGDKISYLASPIFQWKQLCSAEPL